MNLEDHSSCGTNWSGWCRIYGEIVTILGQHKTSPPAPKKPMQPATTDEVRQIVHRLPSLRREVCAGLSATDDILWNLILTHPNIPHEVAMEQAGSWVYARLLINNQLICPEVVDAMWLHVREWTEAEPFSRGHHAHMTSLLRHHNISNATALHIVKTALTSPDSISAPAIIAIARSTPEPTWVTPEIRSLVTVQAAFL